jgi:hypothetical protein
MVGELSMNAICGDTTIPREAIIKFDTHRSERQSRIVDADLFTESFVLWQIAFMVQPKRIRYLLKKWEAYGAALAAKRKCRRPFRTTSKAFACPHVRTTLGTRDISVARSPSFNVWEHGTYRLPGVHLSMFVGSKAARS